MTQYIKCQQHGCDQVATWKTGTWWLCEKHCMEIAIKWGDQWMSSFGTTYKHGPCKAEDYWVGKIPSGMTVEIEENKP